MECAEILSKITKKNPFFFLIVINFSVGHIQLCFLSPSADSPSSNTECIDFFSPVDDDADDELLNSLKLHLPSARH